MGYTAPSYEEANRMSERRSSMFDGMVVPGGPKMFKARQGPNTIRILPPTWGNAVHYSYEVKIHNDVGPNKQAYLCLKENDASPNKDCPLCEERYSNRISNEDKDRLRARPRNYIYLIDRQDTNSGVQLWSISTQSDKEILAQSLIKRTQRYLPIVHPIDGYDVDFRRDGDGLNTRYRGFMVSRESSVLSTKEDQMMEWINYIDSHPIPEVLQFYSPEHIRDIYQGQRDSDRGERDTSSRDREEERVEPRHRPPIGEEPSSGNGRDAGNGHDAGGSDPLKERLRARLGEREANNQR
jgi:hypothetical protein